MLNNLAYLINKQFHTSTNLRNVRLGSEIFVDALLYFTPMWCSAVQGFSNGVTQNGRSLCVNVVYDVSMYV